MLCFPPGESWNSVVLNLTVSLSSYCDRNMIIQAMNEKTNVSERESEEKRET